MFVHSKYYRFFATLRYKIRSNLFIVKALVRKNVNLHKSVIFPILNTRVPKINNSKQKGASKILNAHPSFQR